MVQTGTKGQVRWVESLLGTSLGCVMKIKINYFASLREEVGRAEDVINSDEISLTAKKVWVLATRQEYLPDKVLVAVNQEYVDLNTAVVVDGDEIAFFPPVTGG